MENDLFSLLKLVTMSNGSITSRSSCALLLEKSQVSQSVFICVLSITSIHAKCSKTNLKPTYSSCFGLVRATEKLLVSELLLRFMAHLPMAKRLPHPNLPIFVGFLKRQNGLPFMQFLAKHGFASPDRLFDRTLTALCGFICTFLKQTHVKFLPACFSFRLSSSCTGRACVLRKVGAYIL